MCHSMQDVLCEAVFGEKLDIVNNPEAKFSTLFSKLLSGLGVRQFYISNASNFLPEFHQKLNVETFLPFVNKLPLPSLRDRANARHELEQNFLLPAIMRKIKKAESGAYESTDKLDLMDRLVIAMFEESGSKLTDEQLLGHVMTLAFAGIQHRTCIVQRAPINFLFHQVTRQLPPLWLGQYVKLVSRLQ